MGCCPKDDNETSARAVVAGLTAANSADKIAAYIRDELPHCTYPGGQFAGRGVVIVAGGIKYGVCAWVAIRALRHVGCQLPIEVWYRGPKEKQPALEELTAPFDCKWVDAFAVRDNGHPHARLNGWETKPFAIQWSSFEEVLFVDADNVAVRDPTYLFDAPEYREAGTVLWPDYARMAPKREAWDVFGLRDYATANVRTSERCVESGQILIDKRRAWQALCLANWHGERSRFYFSYVYGDKELFHLCWRRLQQPYAMPSRGIFTLQGTMCQHDFAGERVFQHRNFNKWNLTKNNPRPGFLLEKECLAWLDELKAIWSPAAETFSAAADRAAIAALDGRRYAYYRNEKREREIVFRADGTFREGGAKCERYWTVRDGRLRIAKQDGSLIMDLDPDGDHWKGRWLQHEKMPVRLELVRPQPAIVIPQPMLPACKSLAIVAAYFNPQQSTQRLANLRRFVACVKALQVPLYLVEGIADGQWSHVIGEPGVTVWPVVLRDVIWQKERLLNYAINRLPPNFDAVGWWDSDVLFDYPDLVSAILDGLSRWPVLQPWSECTMLDENHKPIPWFGDKPTIVSMAAANRGQPGDADCATKHPGFAWCARRDTLHRINGLYECFPTGSGDTVMAMGFYGNFESRFLTFDRMSPAAYTHWKAWGQRAYDEIQGRVGCVPCAIQHLYHGPIEQRMYNTRWRKLAELGFDPARDLRVSDMGALEWTPEATQPLVQYVRHYLLHDRGEK